jgi:hypothetical protein
VGVSVIVGGAICVGIKLAVPQIQLGFAWKALLAIPGTFVYLGFGCLIHLLVPAEVTINEKYMSYSTGQSCWRVKLLDIESSKLIVFSPDHIRLIIRSKGKVRKLPVPASADLQLLVSLLGSTIVFDKRRHFTAARSLMNRTSPSTDAGEQSETREWPSSSDLKRKSVTAAP